MFCLTFSPCPWPKVSPGCQEMRRVRDAPKPSVSFASGSKCNSRRCNCRRNRVELADQTCAFHVYHMSFLPSSVPSFLRSVGLGWAWLGWVWLRWVFVESSDLSSLTTSVELAERSGPSHGGVCLLFSGFRICRPQCSDVFRSYLRGHGPRLLPGARTYGRTGRETFGLTFCPCP